MYDWRREHAKGKESESTFGRREVNPDPLVMINGISSSYYSEGSSKFRTDVHIHGEHATLSLRYDFYLLVVNDLPKGARIRIFDEDREEYDTACYKQYGGNPSTRVDEIRFRAFGRQPLSPEYPDMTSLEAARSSGFCGGPREYEHYSRYFSEHGSCAYLLFTFEAGQGREVHFGTVAGLRGDLRFSSELAGDPFYFNERKVTFDQGPEIRSIAFETPHEKDSDERRRVWRSLTLGWNATAMQGGLGLPRFLLADVIVNNHYQETVRVEVERQKCGDCWGNSCVYQSFFTFLFEDVAYWTEASKETNGKAGQPA
ncbi:MAG: hypothetical protein KDB07_12945, partial [Planctomycetes bacterium]|nr:hypothetical protein [Planctomycetota bacterium]